MKDLFNRIVDRIRFGPVIPNLIETGRPSSEANDCVVRALMTVKRYSYRNARKKAEAKGRIRRDGMPISKIFDLMKAEGVKTTHIRSRQLMHVALTSSLQEFKIGSVIKIKDFAKEHQSGKFLIVINGHAMALIDGVLYGNGNERSNHEVLLAFEF